LATIRSFDGEGVLSHRQKIVVIQGCRRDPAKQILFVLVQQGMALHRPPARELRDEFGLDQNFSVEGAVSLEDVPATLSFVSIEPFARQPVRGGAFDRNARNQQEKTE